MRNLLLLFVICAVGTACENAEAKAARLNQDRLTSCLVAQYAADSVKAQRQADCDAKTRAYNQFIGGH